MIMTNCHPRIFAKNAESIAILNLCFYNDFNSVVNLGINSRKIANFAAYLPTIVTK